MKKTILLFLFAFMLVNCSQAQTFSEWFKQNKTQQKYLLQQIAALQLYIGYAQEGYDIAHGGLTTIGGFSQGEFDLHGLFFKSLQQVNPEILHYARVADIIALQIKIVHHYHSTSKQLYSSDSFSNKELNYMDRVFERLLEDCNTTLDQLLILTTDGKLEMKDKERLGRINKLYLDMKDRFTFSESFANDAKILAVSRGKEQNDIKTSRAWQGIK